MPIIMKRKHLVLNDLVMVPVAEFIVVPIRFPGNGGGELLHPLRTISQSGATILLADVTRDRIQIVASP